MPFYESQPTIYPLYRLLEEVLSGEIRVPRFQRPGTESTWDPEQRGNLLDSVLRSFPIGTILLWSTTEDVKTFDVVGGARVPRAPGRQRLRLVLDGHQRISTLVAIMGPSLRTYESAGTRELGERWLYDLADEPAGSDARTERDRFVLIKEGAEPETTWVPLELVMDRVRLNAWIRARPGLTSAEISRADTLRDRFREYSVPIATLVTESLDEATQSFHRINSSGTPMGAFHMVTALAYTAGFDPQERFGTTRSEKLEPEGWGALAEDDMLRVCAGVARHRLKRTGQHPSKLDIQGLAKDLRAYPDLIDRVGDALVRTVGLLRRLGIHGPCVLPYTWQLIVLAIEVGRRDLVDFDVAEHPALERWFWLTTYGGVFAGVSSAVVDRATQALGSLLGGGGWDAMKRDTTLQVGEVERFDFRAARSRGLLLQMARQADEGSPDGPSHLALVSGASAVQTLVAKQGRSCWYNLVIEPSPDGLRERRRALRERAGGSSPEPRDDDLLRHMGIEPGDTGSLDDLLQARRRRLSDIERDFVSGLGLNWL